MTKLSELIEHLEQIPPYLNNKILIIGLLTATFFLWIVSKIKKCKKLLLCVSSETGEVFITKKALAQMLNEICTNQGCMNCKLKLEQKRKKLYVKIFIQLKSDQNLNELSQSMHSKITEILSSKLGFDEIGKIDIIVYGVNKGTTCNPTPENNAF